MRDNRVTRLPEEALRYAAIGWHVFPLQPRGKHPLIPKDQGGSGCHDATTDPAIITDWWTRQPLANIGIACGPSRLVVLDIDGEEGGNWLRWLLDENPEPWPEHPFSLTRTGGHVIFRAPPGVEIFNRQGFPAPKLDIRGAGGSEDRDAETFHLHEVEREQSDEDDIAENDENGEVGGPAATIHITEVESEERFARAAHQDNSGMA